MSEAASKQPPTTLYCTKLVVDELSRSARFYQEVFGFVETAHIQAIVGGEPIEEIILANPKNSAERLAVFKYIDRGAPSTGEVILCFFISDLQRTVDHVLALGGAPRRKVVA